tara:strand:+ start:15351 stop:15731 length:381 start_codon:yes stop_codon:yes gene_type:complete
MASNLTVDTLTKGATTLNTDELVDVNNTRVAKAWVNFNGTGTPAIRASFNISSITDNGTGNYTISFTTAMSDANYVVSGQGSIIGTDGRWQFEYQNARTTSTYRFLTVNTSQVPSDSTYACVAIFR